MDPETSWNGLHVGANVGAAEVCEELIASGAEINATSKSDETALHIAAAQGFAEIAKMLIDKKCNIDPRDNLQVSVHCPKPYLALTHVLQNTPLIRAAQRGREEVVAALLQANARPSNKNLDGFSALDCARDGDHEALVQLLSE